MNCRDRLTRLKATTGSLRLRGELDDFDDSELFYVLVSQVSQVSQFHFIDHP